MVLNQLSSIQKPDQRTMRKVAVPASTFPLVAAAAASLSPTGFRPHHTSNTARANMPTHHLSMDATSGTHLPGPT